METPTLATSPAPAPSSPVHTTPRDFFLWLGAIAALYSSVVSAIVLLFNYLNRVYPDALDYSSDPLGGEARAAMATLIIAAPLAIILFRIIRRTVEQEPARTELWVRRWAIVATLFIAGAVLAIDLAAVLNGFLGGELTTRFALKALVILLIAAGVFMHFLAELRGYWRSQPRCASYVGIAFIIASYAIAAAGFIIIGTPAELRAARFDQQRVYDLRNLQAEVKSHWQTTGVLPTTLEAVTDEFSWFTVPLDPETETPYEYTVTGDTSFTLCATFSGSSDNGIDGDIPSGKRGADDSFAHDAGRTCFDRTIDPVLHPRLNTGN